MKISTLFGYCLVTFLAASAATTWGQTPGANPSPANAAARFSGDTAEVAKLVQAATPEDVILAYIKASPRRFDLTAEDMLNLQNLGASPKVQAAMLEHDRKLKEERGTAAVVAKAPAESGVPASAVEKERASAAPADQVSVPEQSTPEPQPVLGADGVLRIPPPPHQVVPPPKPLKRAWTSTMVVEQAPPPAKLEWIPIAPGTDYCWIPGQWAWRGGQWAWQPGYWLKRPSPGLVWVNGYWAQHGRGWIWIPGRWR